MRMRSSGYGQVFSIYLGVLSYAILVFPKLISLFVVLFIIIVAVGHFKNELSWRFSIPSLLLMLLYLVYLCGVFFSHELSNGLRYAEYKFSLLVIPLLLSQSTKFEFKFQWAVWGLLIGLLSLGLIGISSSYNCYDSKNSLLYCFSSSKISPIHHPSYTAVFLCFSVACLWYGLKKGWAWTYIYILLSYFLFALLFYFLCMSLAAMLFLGLLAIVLLAQYGLKKVGKVSTMILILTLPVAILLLLNYLPGIKDDFTISKNGIVEYIKSPNLFLHKRANETEIPGNHKRLILWTVTSELILEHPFGVGTGNVDEYVHERLSKYGFNQLVKEDLNPHNQYLQTGLEIGIFGLAILLLFICLTMILAYNRNDFLMMILISSFAFNMLFESMLQRQSGLVFLSFWVGLLLIKNNRITEFLKT